MDTSMHKIVKTKEPKDQKDLMFNVYSLMYKAQRTKGPKDLIFNL